MLSHTLDMSLGIADSIFNGLADHVFLIGLQTDFRIDDNCRVIRIIDHHVRDHRPSFVTFYLMTGVVRNHTLGEEMHPFHQTGVLKDIRQQHFSEITLHLRISGQSVRQIASFIAHRLGTFENIFDVFLHGGALRGALFLGLPDTLVKLSEFLLNGLKQLSYRL